MREIWLWRNGRIEVHALRGDRYAAIARSEVLPQLDLDELRSFLRETNRTAAVRAYRERIRSRRGA